MTVKQNPTALVTGAAGGIGAASARALAAIGYTVIGTDVDDAAGAETFKLLGAPHQYRTLDVRDPVAWQALVADVGPINLIHLNAGVMSRPKGAPLMDDALGWLTTQAMHKVMSVNFEGVVNGIIAVKDAPGLARIIITASGAALFPLEMDPYYTASKYGILGLALSIEPALRTRGIRLDVLCPGAIDTDITAPDVRNLIKMEPVSFMGDCIAALATTDERGPVWTAYTEAEGLQRYEVPSQSALDVTDDL
jgi:NAD(P)-dependent dehydrogenase (short-subunit alcohol dehydrogenase family)